MKGTLSPAPVPVSDLLPSMCYDVLFVGHVVDEQMMCYAALDDMFMTTCVY